MNLLVQTSTNEEKSVLSVVDINIKQRNGRKCWTFVVGLDKHVSDEELKSMLKMFKRSWGCNGCIKKGELQLQGNHAQEIKDILVDKCNLSTENINIHGGS